MVYFKVVGAILFLFFFVSFAEAGKAANCTAFHHCEPCLKYNETTCFWCSSTSTCMKKDGVLPKGCKSIDWRYFDNCSVAGYVWVIVLPVVGFVVLIAIACGFYCFCCRCNMSKKGASTEEAKFHRKRMELKAKHAERRAERKLKTDEIRKKYVMPRSSLAAMNGCCLSYYNLRAASIGT